MTLTDDQLDFLRAESHRTGLSIAELVRRALDLAYSEVGRPSVRGWDVRIGAWRRPDAAVVGRHRPPRRLG